MPLPEYFIIPKCMHTSMYAGHSNGVHPSGLIKVDSIIKSCGAA